VFWKQIGKNVGNGGAATTPFQLCRSKMRSDAFRNFGSAQPPSSQMSAAVARMARAMTMSAAIKRDPRQACEGAPSISTAFVSKEPISAEIALVFVSY